MGLWVGIFKENNFFFSLQIDDEYVQKSRREVDLMMERHRKALETLEIELETNMRELGALQVCVLRPKHIRCISAMHGFCIWV